MMNLNLIIIGHGNMRVDDGEIYKSNVNVFTLAPPTASCMYHEEVIHKTRDDLTQLVNPSTSFLQFVALFRKMKKKHLGVDYCDDVWITEFAKMQKYDPSKGCNVQHNHIIEKEFYFQQDNDPDITSGMGVWAYVHDREPPINILHLFPPTKTPRYLFSDIIQFCRKSFPFHKYTNINVVDCTCSVIPGNPPRDTSLDRTQRKWQRRLVRLPPPSPSSPLVGGRGRGKSGSTSKSRGRNTRHHTFKRHIFKRHNTRKLGQLIRIPDCV
jgi:hypothetical protein